MEPRQPEPDDPARPPGSQPDPLADMDLDTTVQGALEPTVQLPPPGSGAASPGTPPPGTPLPTPAPGTPLPHRLGEFVLERELGRGGMGVVWAARSTRLGRRVALKLLPAEALGNAELRERFEIEARAAARLRHPHLVGVHALGEESGQLYIAMDLVEGGSLKDRLRREGPLEPLAAAGLVERLARAVAHAHSHAILHRDLKPANVLLTPQGEPMLTDFGLAKDLAAEMAGVTRSGQILGTPAYMPPEQAGGALDQVDRRADVYSLGAVLYECLTGRPPFSGPNVQAVLAAVLEREPVPPSRLRPGVPRDLDVICLRCLEKEPERRYASALELADDLHRAVNDLPILASAPGWSDRLGKWARRRRSLVRSLAGLAAVGLVAGALVTALVMRRLERERQAAMAASQRAEANAALARQALSQLVLGVRDRLAEVPGAEVRAVRGELLGQALAGLMQLEALQPRDRDPALTADAHLQLGDLAGEMGALEEARTHYQHGLEAARAWLARDPEARPAVVTLLCRLGRVERLHGTPSRAVAPLEEALALARPAADRAALPGPALADLQEERGDTALVLGDLPTARACYAEVLQLRRQAPPGAAPDPLLLAHALERAGRAALLAQQPAEARALREEALAQVEAACNGAPSTALLQRECAIARLHLAEVEAAQGEHDRALPRLNQALGDLRAVLALDPRNEALRRELGQFLVLTATVRREAGQPRPARAALEEALPLLREVAGRDQSASARGELAQALRGLAELDLAAGQPAAAAARLDEAVAITRELAEAAGNTGDAASDLADLLHDQGRAAAAAGDLVAASDALLGSLTLRRVLLQADPSRTQLRTSLPRTLHALASVLDAAGQRPQALERAEEGLREAEELLRLDPDTPETRWLLVMALNQAGNLREAGGDFAGALALAERAEAESSTLADRRPVGAPAHADFVRRRRELAELIALLAREPRDAGERWQQGLACASRGDWVGANQRMRRALEEEPALRADLDQQLLYLAACVAARAAELLTGEEAEAARRWALGCLREDAERRRAARRELLGRAEAAKGAEAAALRAMADEVVGTLAGATEDPDLAGLRERPEFQAIYAGQ